VWHDLQQFMQDLVGLIRRKPELEESLKLLGDLRERVGKVSVGGGRKFNPGWHLALDLRNIMLIADCVAQAALERQESRGGHTRDDFPEMSPEWRKIILVCSLDGDRVVVKQEPMVPMRADLLALFDTDELKKYYTKAELPPAGEETG